MGYKKVIDKREREKWGRERGRLCAERSESLEREKRENATH
jgi:hypothetical protein